MTNNAIALKLKQVASYISRGTAPSYVEASPIRVVNQACVSSSGLDFSRVKYHDPEDLEKVGSWIHQNDILVNSTGTGTLGRVAFVNQEPELPIFADGHVTILRDDYERFYPKFLYHYMSIQQERLTALCSVGSTNQIELNSSRFGDLQINLPPVSKQRQIADYLDQETARLDALITAKQRLLMLLGEKRRSLITQSVTKGLDTNVSLKKLELGWMREIPEHWEIEHLKYHLSSIEQGWSPLSDSFPAETNEWGVLKVGAVNGWKFNPNENKRIPPELEPKAEYEIQQGDLLVSRANTPELVGSAALVKSVRQKLMLCDKLYRLKMYGQRLDPEFLVFYLRSLSGRHVFERDASGASSSMQNISQDILLNMWIPIPPIAEQKNVVTYLSDKLLGLRRLEDIAHNAISLLQERRVSLIAATVTGRRTIK